ncbi:OmpW/AlkL family protein [Haliea sp. E17]|uniref:OmpW/AlkL family protein n=1 Tax=Haliea sp. E17 TaxID=3401576 RepID=UPI003AB06886
MKKLLNLALATLVAGAAASTQAYETGDLILRAGVVTVDPDASSDTIDLGVEGVPTLEADVDSSTQLSIIPVWMLTESWGLELLAATPFDHDISVSGGGLNLDAGKTKQLPPTLTLQWYPRGGQTGWQPYLGIGLNYTLFFSEDVDGELKGALNAVLGATDANLKLDDSFGLSASAGVDIPLGEHWSLNAGLWYIDIDTEATLTAKFADGSKAPVKFDVDIDPWVYNFGIAYKF